MGCGEDIGGAMSWMFDPAGNALGLKGGGDLASGALWNIGKDIKSDWSVIKHMLVPDMRRDREIMTNGSTNARNIVYGEARISGQMGYAESAGANNEFLHLLVIHTGHVIDSFGQTFLDDRLLSTFGANAVLEQHDGTQTDASAALMAASAATPRTYTFTGNTASGVARIGNIMDPVASSATIKGLFAGMTVTGTGVTGGTTIIFVGDTYVDISLPATATATATSLVFNGISPVWSSTDKLLGCAYSYVKFTYNDTLFPSGLPTLKVVIKGRRVYDPRTGLTAWSDNPALCAADYMVLSTDNGGMGCTSDEIDWTSVTAAADICDELVAANTLGTVTEKRYTCNGSIKVDGTPNQILSQILTSMIGNAIFSQGIWKIYAGSYYPVALDGGQPITIDESWLNGSIQFNLGTSKNDRVNTVKGQFLDPTDLWASKDFPVIINDAYVTEDGGEELTADISLNFTTSITMSQRIGRIIMERSRRGKKLTYPCNMKAFKIAPHEIIRVDNSQLGLNQAIYRVTGWSFSAFGGINLQLNEESPNVYNWAASNAVGSVTIIPNVILPTPWIINPPTSLGIVETPIIIAGQVSRSQIVLTWTGNDATATKYTVTLDGVDYASGITDTSFVFNNMLPGTYTIGVIAINATNGRSLPATIVHTVTTTSLVIPGTISSTLDLIDEGDSVHKTLYLYNNEIRIREL